MPTDSIPGHAGKLVLVGVLALAYIPIGHYVNPSRETTAEFTTEINGQDSTIYRENVMFAPDRYFLEIEKGKVNGYRIKEFCRVPITDDFGNKIKVSGWEYSVELSDKVKESTK
jgi:hypothetical protein